MNCFLLAPEPIIATIFLSIKLRDTGTFSNVLDVAPTLYTSFNKSSDFKEKCSSGIVIFPFNSVDPIPSLKSKKSS